MEDQVFFAWSDAMSVGIAEIDDQHKVLVDILNRLFSAMVQRESHEVTTEILDTLVDYSSTHFGLEEKLMQEAGYDPVAFVTHQCEHRAFIEKIGDAADQHLEGRTVSFEIVSFLKRWLRDHFLVTDKKYASALQDMDYSNTAWADFARNVMASKQSETARHRQWWKIW